MKTQVKKFFLAIFLFVATSFAANANKYMYCDGHMAVTFETDKDGNRYNYHAAGGCAFGIWLVQLEVAPRLGGNNPVIPVNDDLARQLNENFAPLPSDYQADISEELMLKIKNHQVPKVFLDPAKLSKPVLSYLLL